MSKVGIIGGMGPEATLEYYRRLTYGYQELTGNASLLPSLTIESVDMYAMLDLCARREYEFLTEFLLKAVHNLAAAGVTFAAMASNTPHIVFDRLRERSPLPLVSIVDCTVEEAERQGCRKPLLLGTLFTMREDFYKKPFRDKGIGVVTPEEALLERVNRHIMDELELGIIKDETREFFVDFVSRMQAEQKVDAVILGCTELPLLLSQEDLPVTALDTMDIHVRSILNRMVG